MNNLPATVARMKSEILADIAAGTVPASVSTFSELHDYVDANEYGGFCDPDSVMGTIIALQDERDSLTEEQERNWSKTGELEELQEQNTAFANAAQNAVDAWIKTGVLKGSDVIQKTIFKLSAIQKTQPPTSKVWQDIGAELEPLFKRMRAIVS